MSCWEKQVVLRMPAKTVGIWFPWDWERFEEEFGERFTWMPGSFAPALCSKEKGYFIDYILEDEEPADFTDGEFDPVARKLTAAEKKLYLPVFQKMFPQFSLREMEDVHYCAFVWYNGTDAPYCY